MGGGGYDQRSLAFEAMYWVGAVIRHCRGIVHEGHGSGSRFLSDPALASGHHGVVLNQDRNKIDRRERERINMKCWGERAMTTRHHHHYHPSLAFDGGAWIDCLVIAFS